MDSKTNNEAFLTEALKLFEAGLDDSTIASKISKLGANETKVSDILKKIKVLRHKKRRKTGTTIVLIGSILLLVGFVSTVALFQNDEPFRHVMYGLTIGGIIAIVIGLILIFE
ncbi:MAG: hypothetical protein HYU69_04465 [Bacteroidetes bacterium]|nr:hypothetical protein [Bacteroidota bacterium]